jgi:hypothetical protein
MDVKGIEWRFTEWIHLASGSDQWQAEAYKVINFAVSKQIVEIFLLTRGISWNALHGIGEFTTNVE